MELVFEPEIFKEALNRLATVADKKNSKAVLNNCLFQVNNGNVSLTASDVDTSARIILSAQVTGNTSSFCVNLKHIFEIVKELQKDKITLLKSEENNSLQIKCRKSCYNLFLYTEEEFPTLSFGENKNYISINANEITKFINKTSHSMSNDETRIFLNGIFLVKNNDSIRAVAIDGHRLALYDIKEFTGSSEVLETGVIIPRKGIQELKKLAESSTSGVVDIAIDESVLYAKSDNKNFLNIRLISREYPKYSSVIPSKVVNSLEANKAELLESLKRVRILANEKTNGVKLIIENGRLTISTNHPTAGSGSEEISINYSGDRKEIGFNAKYLIDVLSVIDGEMITIEFNNELSPVLISNKETSNFISVVMPLKL